MPGILAVCLAYFNLFPQANIEPCNEGGHGDLLSFGVFQEQVFTDRTSTSVLYRSTSFSDPWR